MGLDIGITIQVPQETIVDVAKLGEETATALYERFGGTNGMYCRPLVYSGDQPGEYVVSVRVIQRGAPLIEAGYEVEDLYRTLALFAFTRFDPVEGLTVEAWSE